MSKSVTWTFGKSSRGKIVENWVSVDFPHVLQQLGVDVFDGEGWEHYDSGAKVAPRPDEPVPRHG